MAVSTTVNRITYTGDGATVAFSVTYAFYNQTHLQVYLDGVLKTLTTHYTVSPTTNTPNGVIGGTVTFLVAPGNGVKVLIVRVVPYTQTLDLVDLSKFPADSVESGFDLSVMKEQQLNEVDGRALQWPLTVTTAPSNQLPDPTVVGNQGKVLRIKTDGSGVDAVGVTPPTVTVSGFMETVLDDADAATARTTLGAEPARSQGFRLTLTTGVPVTTADVTGAGTLYCTPYQGNHIALYSGTAWIVRTSAEFSLVLTLTSGKPYDVFCYDNAGVPTLEVLVWTNDTTRATALAYQDGVLVKSGAATRRYLGTLYASGANQTEDSAAKRYLWNYYHRVARKMYVKETTDSWTYTTATMRQANGAAANQLDYVVGVSEDLVSAQVAVGLRNTAAGVDVRVGVGVDSTSVSSVTMNPRCDTLVANTAQQTACTYSGYPGVGRHFLAWLEYSAATGTTTWFGDAGADPSVQSGIEGVVWA